MAIAAAGRALQADDVARGAVHQVAVAQLLRRVGVGVADEARVGARLAAHDAPGRQLGAVAVARRDHAVGRQQPEFHRGRVAAALAAGAAGVRYQAVADDLDRHLGLVDLHRRVLQERVVGAAAFDAVMFRSAAGAAAARADRRQHLAALARGGLDVEQGRAAGRAGRQAIGHGAAEDAEGAGLDDRRHQAAHAHGRRRLRIDHRAFRQDGTAGPYAAGVEHVARRQGMHDVDQADRDHRMVAVASGGYVQRRGDLRVAAGEIQLQFVAAHAQRDLDAARVAAHGIFVGVLGEAVLAVRDLADQGAGLLLGVIEDGLGALHEFVHAEPVDDLVHLALADIERGDLGVEVAAVLLRHAHIDFHDAQHFLVDDAVARQQHRRDAQALLVDFGQGARQRRRHGAAHVGIVDVAADEADQAAVAEHRLPDVHVRGMGGHEAAVRIVGEIDVAFAIIVEHGDDPAIVQPGVPGRAEGLGRGEGLARRRHQLRREVLGFLHEGRIGGAHQRIAHRLGGGGAMVGEHLQAEIVHGHDAAPSVMRRLAYSSTRHA
ncbi:Uncharacterised protein [Bordetella pertussis]|nr:Uncharacterised protein [Bordetella pertussis]CFV88885.1 Uncharacterised protein [Bordetella pertussis]CPP34546.1 Uncharacterised protein [Bordetella pertussis]